MAAIRLLRMSRPLGQGPSNEVFSSSVIMSIVSRPRTLSMCLNKVRLSSENQPGGGRKPPTVKAASSTSGCMLISEPKTDTGMGLALPLGYAADVISHWMKFIAKQSPHRWHIQMYVEKVIIDCRFFTLLATVGSLLSSTLCFAEGCSLILESYFQYFHIFPQMSEREHVMLLLIEAVDMFLMATAMLIFGLALHVIFVGQKNLKQKEIKLLQKLSSRIGMESAMQAKLKIGHVVMMILQVQVLKKFKSVPVTNGMDLACFAGAVFLSSACIFLLSRFAVAPAEARR